MASAMQSKQTVTGSNVDILFSNETSAVALSKPDIMNSYENLASHAGI